ncbi:hypothetical protein GCM10025767_17550 [Thalassotalea piscium]|uniref:ABC-type sulfate transport system permease component n=1 Tax=Thalassotalea piscium TaxID=1230533 RepID=A0A7X0NEW0_9GAMM|nr:ABC-type sulfate transport system permease component [Thalassotalea piscium]
MGIKFWVVRSIKVFLSIFVILIIIEQLKGHDIQNAVMFSLLWSFLSTLVFISSRVYQSRKGVVCTLCNDTPEQKTKTKN